LFETFGKTINQLLLTNLNIRENDLRIIQNQQTIIENYVNFIELNQGKCSERGNQHCLSKQQPTFGL
jgi:hypothetical protein